MSGRTTGNAGATSSSVMRCENVRAAFAEAAVGCSLVWRGPNRTRTGEARYRLEQHFTCYGLFVEREKTLQPPEARLFDTQLVCIAVDGEFEIENCERSSEMRKRIAV